MDLAPTSKTYDSDDRRWLRDRHGLSTTVPVQLDGDAFPAGTFPDGVVPSGTVLGIVTATGLAVPYNNTFDADPATAGVQSDGRDVAVGHLLNSETVRPGGRHLTAVVNHGQVKRGLLPAASGLDAAAEADLPLITYRD